MALICCPECNHQISDTALFCPHCGYVLNHKATTSKIQNKGTPPKRELMSKETKDKIYDIYYSVTHLEWADVVADFLRGIPIIGWLLSGIFVFVTAIVSFGLVAFCIGGLLYLLSLLSPFLSAFVFFAGLTAFNYFNTFVWNPGRQGFFWVCTCLFVPCAFVCLVLAIVDFFR